MYDNRSTCPRKLFDLRAAKPARETSYDMKSWIHLPEPRIVVYVGAILFSHILAFADVQPGRSISCVKPVVITVTESLKLRQG
jgi:hypothetical protein